MKQKTGLVFATKTEARSFLKELSMSCIEKKPLKIYKNDNILLIISGIGKVNAGIAASYLIWQHAVKKIINIGAAGATTPALKTGDIFHIDRIIEYDRPKLINKGLRILIPDIMKNERTEFKTSVLATQDIPVISRDHRQEMSKYADLADMEGAAVLQACRLLNAECYLFKYVTDTPDNEEADIINNINTAEKIMFEFFRERIMDLV